ncbi:MAG: hypothetical protein QOJ39_3441 [Candidatus Eremiobacteraeota bacterium]|jgi:hypothetical protein|nr:hypothetical protein [Candidatus Eremiobacteraeota bacterium]
MGNEMSLPVVRTGRAAPVLDTFVAGVIGAVGTDAFISIANQMSPVKVWQFIASAVFGPVAYTSPQYAATGLGLHLILAFVWAYLYALVWSRVSSLRNWVVGGVVWGIVVTVCMDAAEAFRGVLAPLTPSSVTFGVVTNVVFYGLLVAAYLSRSARE